MKCFYRFLSIGLFLLALQAFAKPVLFKPVGTVANKKSLNFDIDLRYWSTTGYYDQDGTEVDLGNNAFNRIESSTWLTYGFSKQFEFQGAFRVRQNNSDLAGTTISSQGLESLYLGSKYALKPMGSWRIAFDGRIGFTPYSNEDLASGSSVSTTEMVLGDSGTSILLGAHFSYRWSKDIWPEFSLSYHMPPNDLSSEFLWDTKLSLLWSAFNLYGGARGIYSGEGDSFASAADRPFQNTGSTALYNSFNRSWIRPYVGIRYNFSSFTVGLEGAMTVSGSSTDQGQEIVALFSWTNGGVDPRKLKLEKFKEYDIEAVVVKVSPRGKFIKIDQGLSGDVEKGMDFDIYETDYFGGNKLIATGIVYEVGADWAIVKLERSLSKKPVKKGFVARGR